MLVVALTNLVDMGPAGTESKFLHVMMVNLWSVYVLSNLKTPSQFSAITNGVSNRLRVPAGVDTSVTIAQVIGLFNLPVHRYHITKSGSKFEV
jgi:hypothetical protein